MPEFVDFPISTNPDELLDEFIAELQVYWPNFNPAEGSLAYRAASAICRMHAEGRDVAAAPIPGELFRTAGRTLWNIPPAAAQAAYAETTWVAQDNAGYGPIRIGTVVSIAGVLFETLDEVIFPSGATTVTPIAIIAIEEGSAGGGLGGPGTPVNLEEAYEYVASITLNGATSAGADAEDVDTYTDRLRTLLQLMTPVAVTERDLTKYARIVPGIERATVIPHYDADTATPNSPGHATVAVHGPGGAVVPAPIKSLVDAMLTGPEDRILGGIIHVINPTDNPIDVTATVIAYPHQDLAVVQAQAVGAITDFLTGSNWGLPQTGEAREWYNKKVVSLFDVAGALDRAEGVDRATVIQIEGAAADFNLTGVAPLPSPGVITVTVVAA
jgi:hypothetical protein